MQDANRGVENSKAAAVRLVARRALLQLLEPLAGFVLDSGLSTAELNALFREAAVRSAAAKQLELAGRINMSGIAATTGISRGEIARILKAPARALANRGQRQLQSTNRILVAWHEDPQFTASHGAPADLEMYGRGATFEGLVKKYGRGIPVRALLDELVRRGAIELLATRKIRAKAALAVEPGLSPRVIKAFADRATELLSAMLLNMRQPGAAKFVAKVSDASIVPTALPSLRRELSIKGADFLADVRESLTRQPGTRAGKRRHGQAARVSVTIFYHEFSGKERVQPEPGRRRNFRKERREEAGRGAERRDG